MTVFGICEKGNYRKENQDAILLCKDGRSGLFIVADGVGGSADGARASGFIIRKYDQWWKNVFLQRRRKNFFVLFEEIKRLAEEINGEICSGYGAGNISSTIALLFIHKGIYGYLSAGDSRIYHCGRKGARRITRDDVWENLSGAYEDFRYAGRLVSAVGGYEELEYSCATDKLHFGEIFMLCSDGIYKFMEEGFIKDNLRRFYHSFFLTKRMADQLITEAVDHDTRDNYSLIILKT